MLPFEENRRLHVLNTVSNLRSLPMEVEGVTNAARRARYNVTSILYKMNDARFYVQDLRGLETLLQTRLTPQRLACCFLYGCVVHTVHIVHTVPIVPIVVQYYSKITKKRGGDERLCMYVVRGTSVLTTCTNCTWWSLLVHDVRSDHTQHAYTSSKKLYHGKQNIIKDIIYQQQYYIYIY
jgi:hypothetical protein